MNLHLQKQPHWFISYILVGRLLYASLALFALESYLYWEQLKIAILTRAWYAIAFWALSFLFSFVHIFLVIMDGWSRFQDYKRAKDLFFAHGFQPRIARLFIRSKCQRMSAIVAAKELNLSQEIKEYYSHQGVKWYHFIPYFMVHDPLFIFKKYFWSRTFLEKYYAPKYNYDKLPEATPI